MIRQILGGLDGCVGIVFGNCLEFRQAVTRYAIAQGRNVKICASDKKRLQRIGVRCVEGCPFRIFASLDRKGFICCENSGWSTYLSKEYEFKYAIQGFLVYGGIT